MGTGKAIYPLIGILGKYTRQVEKFFVKAMLKIWNTDIYVFIFRSHYLITIH
jgi:hypothetical protein